MTEQNLHNSPSIYDVAKKANVSLATVSQVYRNPQRVSINIREKVLKTAQELKYVPKFIRKRTAFGNIGILIDKNRGPFGEFYSNIIMGILEQAKKLKWNVSLETYDSNDHEALPAMITEKKVDGVILLSKHEDIFIEKLSARRVPFCVADYSAQNIHHNYVIPNWRQGAILATQYLVDNGHTLIAMIHSPLEKGRVSLERVEGYNQVLEKNGLPFIEGYIANGEFSYEKAYQECKKILELTPRPTAIFCATDVMALGAYKAIKEKKLNIPGDISVIGFDNISWPYFMENPDPEITTIDANKELIGAEALKTVHRLITKGTAEIMTKVLPVRLIEKKSVKNISK